MILNDKQIKERCVFTHACTAHCVNCEGKRKRFRPMIKPFVDHSVKEVNGVKTISYGLSSAGYDIRLSRNDLRIFNNLSLCNIDPKHPNDDLYQTPPMYFDATGRYVYVPPQNTLLGLSVEEFDIPSDIVATAQGKSTYARSGLHCLVTPLEPSWQGTLVVELANVSALPIKVYIEEGIAQIQFHQIEPCEKGYFDKGGRYQKQSATALTVGSV